MSEFSINLFIDELLKTNFPSRFFNSREIFLSCPLKLENASIEFVILKEELLLSFG